MNERNKCIAELWGDIQHDYPERSPEWITEMVCTRFHDRYGMTIGPEHVAEALYQETLSDGQ
jgi:hypothetical protein